MNVYGSTLASGGGSSSYSDLSNKPSINGVTLSGNKTSSDLGISSPISYSTSEQDTGLKWIDNKKIYQKTFSGNLNVTSAVGTETTTEMSIGASVAVVVGLEGMILNGAGSTFQDLNTSMISTNRYIRTFIENNSASNANKLIIGNAWFTSGTPKYYVTIKYTKV